MPFFTFLVTIKIRRTIGILVAIDLFALVCWLASLAGPAAAQQDYNSSFLPDLSILAPSLDQEVVPPPASLKNEGKKAIVPGGKVLDLIELVDLALSYNPTLRESWAEAKAAAQEVGKALAAYYPSLSCNFKYFRSRTGEEFSGGDAYKQRGSSESLELTYLLLDMSGRKSTARSARSKLKAANYSYNQAVLDLVLKVQKAYYSYYAALKTIEAKKADLNASISSQEEAELKYKVGVATKSDVLEARTNTAEMRYKLVSAQGGASIAWVNLALLCGMPTSPRIKVANPAPVDTSLVSRKMDDLVKLAQAMNPGIQALEADIRADKSAIKAANSKLWPYLKLEANISRKDVQDDPLKYESEGMLTLQYVFFSGFADSYEKRKALAGLSAARGKLATQRLSLSDNLRQYYQKYRTAVSEVEACQTYLADAENTFRMQLEMYKVGMGIMVNVTTAMSKLSEARIELINARTNLYLSVANMAHACGDFEKLGVKRPTWKGLNEQ